MSSNSWRLDMFEKDSGSLTFASLATLSVLSAGAASFVVSKPAVSQASDTSVVYLNQAWSQDDREWYYHFSQGSAVLAYDVFLNLEVADGQDLFRSDANSVRYGLVPDAANVGNPDG